MKKRTSTLLIILLCLTALLCACCKETESGPTPSASPAVTEATAPSETATPSAPPQESTAPVEYETADGFMRSFLLASDRDLIGTANEYGDLYRVVYAASLEGDTLNACGSMDYRNEKDQDPISVSDDVDHVFKVDENTEYRKGTESGDVTVSKEEFAELLEIWKDTGMFLELEIRDGVVKSAYLAAQ